MSKMPYPGAEQYKKQNKRRRAWQKVVSFLACIVVFCTTYALILPAITMERDAFCGIEEHTHSEECYEQVLVTQAPAISCSVFTNGENTLNGGNVSVAHTHDASCYDPTGTCICPLAERPLHTHVDACYAPAETQPPHTHEDGCYAIRRGELICRLEESEGHAHGDTCYVPGQTLTCTREETPGHTHSASCETKTLTCTLSTEPAHTHDPSCYQSKLICTQDEVAATSREEEVTETVLTCENTEEGHVHDADTCYQINITTKTVDVPGHTHGDGCYESELACGQSDEAHVHGDACYESEITCGQEEYEGHTHGPACYEPVLNCEIPVSEGHTHGDDCYEQNKTLICEISEETQPTEPEPVLTCGMQELILHTHSDLCEDPCPMAEVIFHTHGEECFTTVEVPVDFTVLTCTQPESEEHVHDFRCYGRWELVCEQEEHTHEDSCYSDPNADVETAAQWEATFAHVELTGDWNRDVLAIAKTQLGYRESEKNFVLWEDGTAHGYTRYGAWYGSPYGDWCAMFVSFCLHYADVEGMPLNWGVRPWIEELTELELYHAAGEYIPQPGDLVFYDWEGDGLSDHVGLVAELIEATEEESAKLKAIEGNSSNCVQYVTYDLNDPVLLGYSELPEPEETEGEETAYYCGLEEHTHGESCYDAAGELICTIPEHSHGEECTIEPVTYRCGLEEHTHGEDCYDEAGNLICTLTEHTHSEACLEAVETTYFCGLEAHTHSGECYVLGVLLCGKEEHTHTILCETDLSSLPEEDRAKVEQVIQRIEEMPSADEIDAKIAEFEEAEDYEGEESWLTEIYQLVGDIYFDYRLLGEDLQPYVVNAEKLLELEYIWSAQALIEEINSAPPTVGAYTSTSEFVELNLYDYNYNINNWWRNNNKYPGFQWNGGAYSHTDYRYYNSSADKGVPNYTTDRNRVDTIDFGNSMISNFSYGNTSNYAKSVGSVSVGNQGGLINALDVGDYGVTNRPIGLSIGTEVMSRTLKNGYPALIDGTSLSYLFGDESADTHNAVSKMNTKSIDGLFLQNSVTGEYSYNSRTNHAQYSNNFFTRYEDIITPNFIVYPFGNFLPFNTISDSTQATQVGAFNKAGGMKTYVDAILADLTEANNAAGTSDWKYTTRKQLMTMLDEYAENWEYYTYNGTWSNISPANAIKDYFQMEGDNPSDDVGFVTQAHLDNMYNIDWDVDTNFFFGMEMKMNFMQPKGGYTGNDTDGDGASDYPMVFYFTGDDDVWVYIDGVLFLDLSGIHRHVGGEIDFVNGLVHYYALSPATGDVSTTPYITYTFAELLTAAGKDTSGLNAKGTFKDYTTHAFNFYYMERGSGSSVCRLNFNFPLLRQNSISVNKENLVINNDDGVEAAGNPDYYFNIVTTDNKLFVGPNSETGIRTYKIMDSSGNYLDGTYETDQYGIFTLKAGQTAVFEGIKENEGEYFVQELIKEEDNEQYPSVYVNGEVSRYNQLIDWQYRKYFTDDDDDNYTGPYGYRWYGRSGYDTDSSANSAFYFKQQNHVDAEKLGSLSIEKVLRTTMDTTDEDATFRIHVELDGEPIPKGTSYTLSDGGTGTVTEAGILSLKAGQKATIHNIVSGTTFKVYEDSGSAEGYVVNYTQENADEATVVARESVSGVVRVNVDVAVTITNADRDVSISIPGTKALVAGDGTERTFTFRLEQVKDQTGTEVIGDTAQEQSVVVKNKDSPGDFAFTLTYEDLTTLPQTFYYRITEVAHGDTLANDTVYVAQVEITEGEDGGPVAAVTALWKNGFPVTGDTLRMDFENVLKGSLTLEKKVEGSSAGEGFTFEVRLAKGDSGVEIPEETSYPITIYENGAEQPTTNSIIFRNGVTTISDFKDGDKVTISDLPYGTTWEITETDADGYRVTTVVTVGDTSTDGSGSETSGSVTVGGTLVTYTNTYLYELPETGSSGTTPYSLVGLTLMTVSLALLIYTIHPKRRKGGKTTP